MQVTPKGHVLMCRNSPGPRCVRTPEAQTLRNTIDRARRDQRTAGGWQRGVAHEGFTQDGAGRWHPATGEARALVAAADEARCTPSRTVADEPYTWVRPADNWRMTMAVDYEEHLRAKHPGVLIYVSSTITPLHVRHVTLDKIIVVADSERGKGKGSAVLAELVRDAEANGWVLGLSPTDEYGTPTEVLERFYGRYGFVPNPERLRTKREREQARNGSAKFRDGSTMLYVEKMVRPPNGQTVAPNDWLAQRREWRQANTQLAVDLYAEMNTNGRTASHAEVLAEVRERQQFVLTEAEFIQALRDDIEERTAQAA